MGRNEGRMEEVVASARDDEDYAVRVRIYPEGDASAALTDTARVALGRAPRALSEPLVWRRGPTTGPRHVQTADTRFRRGDIR